MSIPSRSSSFSSTVPRLSLFQIKLTNGAKKGFRSFQCLEQSFKNNLKEPKSKSLRLKNQYKQVNEILLLNRNQFNKLNQSFLLQRKQKYQNYIQSSLRYKKLIDQNTKKSKIVKISKRNIGQVTIVNNEDRLHLKSWQLNQSKLKIKGWKPEPRQGQVCVVYMDQLFVLGGQNNYPINQISIFSFINNAWIKKTQSNFLNRSFHTGLLYKNHYVVVFGGMSPNLNLNKQRVCLNSVCVFDLDNMQSKNLKIQNESIIEPRRNHAACLMGKNMMIFGGINTKKQYLVDLCYLDLKNLKWYNKEYHYINQQQEINFKYGIAYHAMFSNFKDRKNYPIFSSNYEEEEGIYILGGMNSQGLNYQLKQISFRRSIPIIRNVSTSGVAPLLHKPIIAKYTDNIIIILSGHRTSREIRLLKIKEREFVKVNMEWKVNLGGTSSSLVEHLDQYYLLFGLGPNGYISECQHFSLNQSTSESPRFKKVISQKSQYQKIMSEEESHSEIQFD